MQNQSSLAVAREAVRPLSEKSFGVDLLCKVESGGTKIREKRGPTETRTRISGFKVQGANHYTMGPCLRIVVP